MSVKLIVFLIFSTINSINSDEYLNEAQTKCYLSKKVYFCAKHKLLRYFSNYSLNGVDFGGNNSFVNLVRISDPGNETDDGFFGQPRQFLGDSELTKFLKFLQRQADIFLNHQGLSILIPDEARIIENGEVEESRGKKKQQRELLIPLMMLFKLFKIKVLAALILAGVIFIKKIILVAAIILPSVIASIKNHCKQQQYHVVPYHVNEDHFHHDHEHDVSGTGFGYSGYGNAKDWERSKVKRFVYGYPY